MKFNIKHSFSSGKVLKPVSVKTNSGQMHLSAHMVHSAKMHLTAVRLN